jgi:hypothetical protein
MMKSIEFIVIGMVKNSQVYLKSVDTIRLSVDNLGEQNSKIVPE